eukprot:scaffold42941_cov17-Tisochrysis_lutea.AAC.1
MQHAVSGAVSGVVTVKIAWQPKSVTDGNGCGHHLRCYRCLDHHHRLHCCTRFDCPRRVAYNQLGSPGEQGKSNGTCLADTCNTAQCPVQEDQILSRQHALAVIIVGGILLSTYLFEVLMLGNKFNTLQRTHVTIMIDTQRYPRQAYDGKAFRLGVDVWDNM